MELDKSEIVTPKTTEQKPQPKTPEKESKKKQKKQSMDLDKSEIDASTKSTQENQQEKQQSETPQKETTSANNTPQKESKANSALRGHFKGHLLWVTEKIGLKKVGCQELIKSNLQKKQEINKAIKAKLEELKKTGEDSSYLQDLDVSCLIAVVKFMGIRPNEPNETLSKTPLWSKLDEFYKEHFENSENPKFKKVFPLFQKFSAIACSQNSRGRWLAMGKAKQKTFKMKHHGQTASETSTTNETNQTEQKPKGDKNHKAQTNKKPFNKKPFNNNKNKGNRIPPKKTIEKKK